MTQLTELQRTNIINSYLEALDKYTAGEITEESFVKIKTNVAYLLVA